MSAPGPGPRRAGVSPAPAALARGALVGPARPLTPDARIPPPAPGLPVPPSPPRRPPSARVLRPARPPQPPTGAPAPSPRICPRGAVARRAPARCAPPGPLPELSVLGHRLGPAAWRGGGLRPGAHAGRPRCRAGLSCGAGCRGAADGGRGRRTPTLLCAPLREAPRVRWGFPRGPQQNSLRALVLGGGAGPAAAGRNAAWRRCRPRELLPPRAPASLALPPPRGESSCRWSAFWIPPRDRTISL